MPGPTRPDDTRRADRRALFRIVDDAFEEAGVLAGGAVEERFRIAGLIVRIRFAGPALRPALTRALAHLRTDSPAQPDLTLHVWDSHSTGRPLPLLAESLLRLLRFTWLQDRGIRGEMFDFTDATFRAALEGYNTDILNLLDVERAVGMLWVPDWRALPWHESGAPLRTLLSWWFESQGRLLVHGGAVGLPRGGVLLAGRGGSGKSTAALACVGSDLRYAGDDYSLVRMAAGEQPTVSSLYNTAKVKGRGDLARFPWMTARIVNADRIESEGQKPMLFVHEHQPEALIDGFPLKAIVLPRFVADLDAPKVVRVAPESALKALAASTIPQLTGFGSVALRALSRLTRQVPCYLLGTTADVGLIPPTLSELLHQHLN
jgi:hypothetical protein